MDDSYQGVMESTQSSPDHSETDKPSKLYIIQLETGHLKIGITIDMVQRMNAYRTMNPHRFHIVWSGPGTYQDEKRLLRFLEKWVVAGEWVENRPETRDIITTFVGKEKLDFSAINRGMDVRRRRYRRRGGLGNPRRRNDYIHAAERTLADGTRQTYYYHPRSGTRLPNDPDSQEFADALARAQQEADDRWGNATKEFQA